MKYATLTLVMLGACNQLCGMEKNITILQRPAAGSAKIEVSSNDIYERLCSLHLNNFVHQTRIHEKIGNKKMLPGAIYLEVNKQIFSYLQTVHSRSTDSCLNIRPPRNTIFTEEHATFVTQKKAPMIRAILKDHPAAIEYLVNEGFLKEQPIEQNNTQIIISHEPKALEQKTRQERKNIHWQMFMDNK